MAEHTGMAGAPYPLHAPMHLLQQSTQVVDATTLISNRISCVCMLGANLHSVRA